MEMLSAEPCAEIGGGTCETCELLERELRFYVALRGSHPSASRTDDVLDRLIANVGRYWKQHEQPGYEPTG